MTDQRYTGPDGAKRLELLEELAKTVYIYVRHRWPVDCGDLVQASAAIDRDNARVDRLQQMAEDYWYLMRGCGELDDPLD